MQRYEHGWSVGEMEPSDTGDWVRWEDAKCPSCVEAEALLAKAEQERDSLRLELQAMSFNRLKDNEHLISAREQAEQERALQRAALSPQDGQ
jgi:predicted DsbA family dithiol-disulfide isomerase